MRRHRYEIIYVTEEQLSYSEKLKHPLWRAKRIPILKRDNFKCLFCNLGDRPLEVHHILYIRGREPWEYPDAYLQTLCEPCHDIRQELTDKCANALKLALARIPTERLEQVSQRLCIEALEELYT